MTTFMVIAWFIWFAACHHWSKCTLVNLFIYLILTFLWNIKLSWLGCNNAQLAFKHQCECNIRKYWQWDIEQTSLSLKYFLTVEQEEQGAFQVAYCLSIEFTNFVWNYSQNHHSEYSFSEQFAENTNTER